jgi:predicted transcriptional regulator
MTRQAHPPSTSAPPVLGIGGQIRLHRRNAGLTQLELARLMGTSQTVVARMEKDGNVNLAIVGRASPRSA